MDRSLSYCTVSQLSKAIFLLRLSLHANMTIEVRLTMACSILTASWVINHTEIYSVPQLLLRQNLRPT